jgi:hypothetical protein
MIELCQHVLLEFIPVLRLDLIVDTSLNNTLAHQLA